MYNLCIVYRHLPKYARFAYSEIGPEVRCDLSRLLSRKITKRIHSSKPASLNRPINPGPPCIYACHIVQELCESRGGRPGLSVLTSLLVSVDVKLFIEPCFGIGLSLSLICQLTSEDIKQHYLPTYPYTHAKRPPLYKDPVHSPCQTE